MRYRPASKRSVALRLACAMLLAAASFPLASFAFGMTLGAKSAPGVGGVVLNASTQKSSGQDAQAAASRSGAKAAAPDGGQGASSSSNDAAPGGSASSEAPSLPPASDGNEAARQGPAADQSQAAGGEAAENPPTSDQPESSAPEAAQSPASPGEGAPAADDQGVLAPDLGSLIEAEPGAAERGDSLAGVGDALFGAGAGVFMVLPRAQANATFAWTYSVAGVPAGECKLTGWSGSLPTGPNATVKIPAMAKVNVNGAMEDRKVTRIDRASFSSFQNLSVHVDFSTATNLQRIESGAFQFSALKGSLDLPKSLTYLGAQAFQGCPNISSVKFPDNPNFTTIQNYTFMWSLGGKGGLSGTVTIPANVQTIGASAFSANRIDRVKFAAGSKLTSIGASAFANNNIGADKGLADDGVIDFPNTLVDYYDKCFMGNKIKDPRFGNKSIHLYASSFEDNRIDRDPMKGYTFNQIDRRCFAKNKISSVDFSGDHSSGPGDELLSDNLALTSVVISPHWTRLPKGLFKGDTALTNVTVPKGTVLQNVTDEAFKGCTALQIINFNDAPLQDSVNGIAIGMRAFQGCTSLQAVILGITPYDGGQGIVNRQFTVQEDAFQGCTSLKTAIIPEAKPGFHIYYHIGDRAFKDTDLGDYVHSPGALPVPEGTLPLNGREIVDIGKQAYMNSGVKDVLLPSSLKSVGDEAFADDKMWRLHLPGSVTSLGSNILARQHPEGSVYWGVNDQDSNKLDILLSAMQSNSGVSLDAMGSVQLDVPTTSDPGSSPRLVDPLNNDSSAGDYWKTIQKATFARSDVASATDLRYSFKVEVPGRPDVSSTGDATVASLARGVRFSFHWLYDWGDAARQDTQVQWVGDGMRVDANLNGGNYGLGTKPGYHANNSPYKESLGTGWTTALPPSGQAAVDPSSVTAAAGDDRDFYNIWIGNPYSLVFDDNFSHMAGIDAKLGSKDPGSGAVTPNPAYVWGSLAPLENLTYGTASALPANKPPGSAADVQGTGFKMGSYEFEGWATSPDLDEASRVEGSNFFPDGSSISTPDPAPHASGGKVTLYAQWKTIDLSDPGHIRDSLMIPAHIDLAWKGGGSLWSEAPHKEGEPPPADPQAITLSTEVEEPGTIWPDDQNYVYQVFVRKADPTTGDLLVLSQSDGSDPHPIDVLQTKGGVPYSPGASDALVIPLVTLQPVKNGVHAPDSASFYLKSRDDASSFEPNFYYSGTMTFVIKTVTS